MDSSATLTMKASSSSTNSLIFLSKTPKLNPKTLNLCQTGRPISSFFLKSLKCINSPDPSSKNSNFVSFSRPAVIFSPAQTADVVPGRLRHYVTEFQSIPEPVDRVKRLLHYSTLLPRLPDSARVDSNRVMGCTARVWLEAELDEDSRIRFRADSDSEITRGFCHCLVSIFDGVAVEEVMGVKTEDLAGLNVGLVGGGERSRVNTWHNVLVSMQKRTRMLVAERQGKKPFDPFPSLVITSDGIQAKGSYAEAQVGVYRISAERIGCSLADAAAAPSYMNYLEAASSKIPSLHVIYINTSLETKAFTHELVPTITCTSSNVVQSILQIPDLNIWYGPDTYMGANIAELFQ